MIKPQFPTREEIEFAIKKCEVILENKALNQFKNFCLKEGYTECIRMMRDNLATENNKFFVADDEEELDLARDIYSEQMKPIKELKTEIGRTIAVLCNDFLNGQDNSKTFLDESFFSCNKKKVLNKVIDKYNQSKDMDNVKNLFLNDGQKYTALMDNKFKMSGTIRVIDGQVYLEQDEEHGIGCNDEVEKKYHWAVSNGSQDVLSFMGISNFKIID